MAQQIGKLKGETEIQNGNSVVEKYSLGVEKKIC